MYIEACSKIPDYEKCKKFLALMLKEKMEPKAHVYKCMMRACNNTKELQTLYQAMKSKNIYPDEDIFLSIHVKSIKKKDVPTALWLEKEMKKYGIPYPPVNKGKHKKA
jgi:hypothetical protein